MKCQYLLRLGFVFGRSASIFIKCRENLVINDEVEKIFEEFKKLQYKKYQKIKFFWVKIRKLVDL